MRFDATELLVIVTLIVTVAVVTVLYLMAGSWMAFVAVLAFANLAGGLHVPRGTKLSFAVVTIVFSIWFLVTVKPRSTKSKLRRRP